MQPKIEITVPVSVIRAALVCVAKQDIRYYLNGALVEFGAGASGNDVVIVSTNGHVLSAIHAGEFQHKPAQFIIPRSLLERAAKHKIGRNATNDVSIEIDDPSRVDAIIRLVMACDGTSYSEKAIDGKFPDWRRVAPKTAGDGKADAIDPEYYSALFDVFAKLLNRQRVSAGVRLDYSENRATVATHDDCRAFVVAMGLRDCIGMRSEIISALTDIAAAPELQQAA